MYSDTLRDSDGSLKSNMQRSKQRVSNTRKAAAKEQEFYQSQVVGLNARNSSMYEYESESELAFQEKLEELRVEVSKRENQRKFERAVAA